MNQNSNLVFPIIHQKARVEQAKNSIDVVIVISYLVVFICEGVGVYECIVACTGFV